jgi:hypothetical protein
MLNISKEPGVFLRKIDDRDVWNVVSGGGGDFPEVGNSAMLAKECKIYSRCGYTSDEFFHICPNCGKECGSQS